MKRMKRYAKNLYRFSPVSLAAVLCAVSFVCAAETPGGNAGQDGIPQAVHWYDEYVACADGTRLDRAAGRRNLRCGGTHDAGRVCIRALSDETGDGGG